jgi:hypothetical protein
MVTNLMKIRIPQRAVPLESAQSVTEETGPARELRSPEAPRLARVARWWVAGSGRNLSAGPVE